MTFVYYEVYVSTPYVDELYEINYNTELINKYSAIEKARYALRRWAEIKGISYEDNHYFITGMPVCNNAVIEGVGIFYDLDNQPVKFNGDWEYGTYAYIARRELVLDEE